MRKKVLITVGIIFCVLISGMNFEKYEMSVGLDKL
ncbi:hypothetical protein J2S01_002945 [Pectinatus haikarae]|uniref:Uncharacterized protein n=1 Tax=Pectinatus haikarae TaxID=349096 RepID=A0ABT9YCK6_9FIRM|nr:hypothetical protein [Pectinatus haikarae]